VKQVARRQLVVILLFISIMNWYPSGVVGGSSSDDHTAHHQNDCLTKNAAGYPYEGSCLLDRRAATDYAFLLSHPPPPPSPSLARSLARFFFAVFSQRQSLPACTLPCGKYLQGKAENWTTIRSNWGTVNWLAAQASNGPDAALLSTKPLCGRLLAFPMPVRFLTRGNLFIIYLFFGTSRARTHSYELEYNPVPLRDWMVLNSPWFPLAACALYGLFIVFGQAYFSTRPPWNLRPLLALWNLSLSVFSFIGVVRILPVMAHIYSNYSWEENFCIDPESHYGSGTTGLWIQLFILSKVPYVYFVCTATSTAFPNLWIRFGLDWAPVVTTHKTQNTISRSFLFRSTGNYSTLSSSSFIRRT